MPRKGSKAREYEQITEVLRNKRKPLFSSKKYCSSRFVPSHNTSISPEPKREIKEEEDHPEIKKVREEFQKFMIEQEYTPFEEDKTFEENTAVTRSIEVREPKKSNKQALEDKGQNYETDELGLIDRGMTEKLFNLRNGGDI